jgi:radical SAM superfamily enzyme YgiQ (UPF0313 family)
VPDIVLVQPPIEDFFLTAKRTVPYGLALIAAALEQSGFSVEIIDGLATGRSRVISRPPEMEYLEPFYGRPDVSPFGLFHHYRHFGYSFAYLAQRVRKSGAFLAGISALFTPYHEMALKTAAAIRQACPEIRIVVGGHHATVLPQSVLAAKEVDFVIRGEGEEAIVALAQWLRQGGRPAADTLAKISGLAWRRPEGDPVIPPPAVVENLTAQPRPANHLLKSSFYRRRGRGSIVVSASRGCPFDCGYCAVNRDSWQPYRRRPVTAVLDEIQNEWERQEIGFIDFEDENLSLEREWFIELLAGLTKLRRKRKFEVRAMNGLFPPSLDDELLTLLPAAGFRTLNLAVVSCNRDQLARFRRPDVDPAHARVVATAARLGLETVSYLIAAAPGQTAASSLTDLLRLFRRRTLIGLSIFYPVPGSREYERAASSGLLPERLSLLRSSALPLNQDGVCSRIEAATLLRLSRIANFIRYLDQTGLELPRPERFPKKARPAAIIPTPLPDLLSERTRQGIELLAWFLADGRIRGLTPAGEIYEHTVARTLTRQFQNTILS